MKFLQDNILLVAVALVSGAMLLWPYVRRAVELELRHPEVTGRHVGRLLEARLRTFCDDPTVIELLRQIRAVHEEAVRAKESFQLAENEWVMLEALELFRREQGANLRAHLARADPSCWRTMAFQWTVSPGR